MPEKSIFNFKDSPPLGQVKKIKIPIKFDTWYVSTSTDWKAGASGREVRYIGKATGATVAQEISITNNSGGSV